MHVKRILIGLLALSGAWLGGLETAQAQPKANSQNVGVCSPKAYANCIQPNADGSINVSGTISATNPSVGTNNTTAPTSSTQIGVVDGTGKLQPASASNPVPVTGSFAAGYTAAASPTAVTAGANKPGFIDTANSAQYFEPVKPGTTTTIDLSLPSGILGVDGATIATLANPFPTTAGLVAGTALVGKFGIDQTTVGTTNGVSLSQIGATTVSTGTGAQGPGSQRVVVATDTATVAGSASIPAGTNLMGKVGIDQTTTGTTNAVAVKDKNNVAPDFTTTAPTAQVGPYPSLNTAGVVSSATPETCSSGNVANATVACTLATASGKTTYITGFTMTADGATAGLAVTCTLTGTITGTMSYTFGYPIGVAVPAQPLSIQFPYPVPASATNTTIVASCPASGTGGTNAAISATGFQL